MSDTIEIKDDFRDMCKLTKNDIAAAILVLAQTIQHKDVFRTEYLSHELCMGIRYGLFGADGKNGSSIEPGGTAEAISELSNAVDNIANALKENKNA